MSACPVASGRCTRHGPWQGARCQCGWHDKMTVVMIYDKWQNKMSLLRQSLHDISIYKSTTIPKSVFNSNMQLPGICIQHICTILHQRCQFHALSPEPRNAAAVASKASASAVLAGISKATKNPTLISWAFERRFKPKKRKTKHMLKTWENTDMRLRTLTFSKNKKVQKGLCPALTPRRKAAARASNSASWRQSQGNAKGKPVANPHSASIIDVTNGFTSPLPLSIIDSFDDFFQVPISFPFSQCPPDLALFFSFSLLAGFLGSGTSRFGPTDEICWTWRVPPNRPTFTKSLVLNGAALTN